MSSLWTPSGEHQVPPAQADGAGADAWEDETTAAASAWGDADGGAGPMAEGPDGTELTQEQAEQLAAQMAEVQQQLISVPASQIVTQHMVGLFELAALHLRRDPPALADAQLPIDALGLLVEGLGDRLDGHEELSSMLRDIRMAFVAASGHGEAAEG